MSDSITQPLNFTDQAALKVAEIIALENNDKLNLRVYITGGGCSGFQYGFKLDEQINPNDIVIEKVVKETTLVRLVIDALSFQYLEGAIVDFHRDLKGEHFSIDNPNAQATCGCGSSFSI